MARKIIPAATDAPPATARTIRELTDAVYDLQSFSNSNGSEVNASTKGLGATIQNLSEQVADLNSRYATFDNGDFNYNSGAVPSNGTFYEFGREMQINIVSPGTSKQVVVTVGAGEISMDCTAGTLLGEVSFKFSGGGYGTYNARIYMTGAQRFGIPVQAQRAFRLAAGTYTIFARTRAWSGSGSGTSSVNFTSPYLSAEVIGAD